jgi:intracellular sulfur oxidation DsrE/DsrF family protein
MGTTEAAAVERLEAALADQARLGEQYERAIGTSAEQTTFARLQAAGLRVAMCDRAVKAFGSAFDDEPVGL